MISVWLRYLEAHRSYSQATVPIYNLPNLTYGPTKMVYNYSHGLVVTTLDLQVYYTYTYTILFYSILCYTIPYHTIKYIPYKQAFRPTPSDAKAAALRWAVRRLAGRRGCSRKAGRRCNPATMLGWLKG